MLTTILICTRNRCASLQETLASLAACARPDGMNCSVLVVDNGSTDDTRAVVQAAATRTNGLPVNYRWHEPPGRAAALNVVMPATPADIFVCTDDDVRFHPAWLHEITAPLVAGRFDALAGVVRIAPDLLRPWMADGHRFLLSSTDFLNPAAPDSAVGANMAFTSRVLERVPQFDPELGPGRLGFWDDTLFFRQLRGAGFRVGMATQAIVEHHFDPARLNRAALLQRVSDEGRSRAHVAWHWEHKMPRLAALRLAFLERELASRRRCQPAGAVPAEGLPLWELTLVQQVSFLRHVRHVRGAPRVYPRFGAQRLRA